MTDPQLEAVIKQVVVSTLGVDEEDVINDSHFQLDFNATNDDMQTIKEQLEQQLDITLPDFTKESPATISDLYNIVYDSTL